MSGFLGLWVYSVMLCDAGGSLPLHAGSDLALGFSGAALVCLLLECTS